MCVNHKNGVTSTLFLLFFFISLIIPIPTVTGQSDGTASVGSKVLSGGVAHVLTLPIDISVRTFGLAIVAIALALCAIAIYSKKHKDKYEEE